jgi:hypothetical protein
MEISQASKNVVVLNRADLHAALADINVFPRRCGAESGLTRAVYSDDYDTFEMLLQPSNAGFSVSCRLNGQQAYQLNGRMWDRASKIGDVMLVAAAAPERSEIEGFFS